MTEPTGREVAVVEVPEESRALAIANREQVAGLIRPVAPPAEVLSAQNETRALIATALQEGRDYGTVPGTNKPSLLKPGGERITAAMGCYPRYRIIEQEVDHDRETQYLKERWEKVDPRPSDWQQKKTAGTGRNRKFDQKWVWQEKHVERGLSLGLYRYVMECELVHRGSGVVIGQGIGSCSTLESKYIDRPRDLENTVIKMAEKRAFVGAVLNAFGLSDQFTQDVEDNPAAFGLDPQAGENGARPDAEPERDREPEPEPDAKDEAASTEQIEFLCNMIKSSAFKDKEREAVLQMVANGLTKTAATALIDQTNQTLKRRKDKQKESKKQREPEGAGV